MDRAIEDCNRAIQLKPDYADAYTNCGVAYINKGNYDRAIQDGNTAISLRPNFVEAYYNRGCAYSRKGEHGRAIEDFTKAIGLKPDLAVAYHSRGESWLRLKVWEKARLDLTVAVAMGVNIINEFRDDNGNAPGFRREKRCSVTGGHRRDVEAIKRLNKERDRDLFKATEFGSRGRAGNAKALPQLIPRADRV